MAYFFRLIAALSLFVSSAAFAALPATSGYTNYCSPEGSGFACSSSSMAVAVTNWASLRGLVFSRWEKVGTSNGASCYFTYNGSPLGPQSCTAVPGYVCPANSTKSGTSCTCNSGYVEEGSTCVPYVDDQQQLCNSLSGTETYGTVTGSAAPGSSSCNAAGCMATFAGTVIRVKNSAGQYVTEGAMTFTDQKCTFSAATGAVEDTCPGGTTGEVNGRTVCVNFDPKTNTIESVKATTSTTANGSGTATATSTTSTTCSNGSCNSTTTTVINNNGTRSTETKTSDEPQSDFCAKSPNDPQCSKEGSFSGACAAGFACTGDAIQCAVAREQHARNCTLFEGASEEATLYGTEKNKTGSQTAGLPGNDSVSIGPSSFDTSDALGGGSCIGDKSITVAGHAVVIPFSNVCEYLALLGNVLLAVSFLLAGRIVTRG